MRAILLAASLLLTTLAVVPTAQADPACYRYTCCNIPGPMGNPGSPGYLVTNTVHNVGHSACETIDDPVGTVEDLAIVQFVIYTYECVVWGYC